MNAFEQVKFDRAKLSLDGLYLGDTFGQQFFGDEDAVLERIEQRIVPPAPWRYTDDTQMALSIVRSLEDYRAIDRDSLAEDFADRYERDPNRGYGGSMHDTLKLLGQGKDWYFVSRNAFDGMGSFGNGAAMRVAPIGGFDADNLHAARHEAARSAVVTHAHPEAVAGAIGVAIAAALAWQNKQSGDAHDPNLFLEKVAEFIPESEVKSKVLRASRFTSSTTMAHAVAVLGNGALVSAADTVPLALWCAAKHLNDIKEALWFTVSALGDRDTTCAMVGGIVALSVGHEGMPQAWCASREPHNYDD
jgi:ADP-ribosylglycohydrolase